jgi:hypothetical protein
LKIAWATIKDTHYKKQVRLKSNLVNYMERSFSWSTNFPSFLESSCPLLFYQFPDFRSYSKTNQSKSTPSYPICLRSNSAVSSNLCFSFPCGFPRSNFPIIFCIQFSFLAFVLHSPPKSSSFDLTALIIFCAECKLSKSSLDCFIHSPQISSLFRPNILLSILFLRKLNL